MTQLTGAGDPARSMALLWRESSTPSPAPARPGPKPTLDVDRIVAAAVALADDEGVAGLSMRRVADRLGVAPMSLYTHVPGKGELVDLMVDAALGESYGPGGPASGPWPAGMGWRDRLERVARDAWDVHVRHPWVLRIATGRPPLGPSIMAKYERELSAVDGIGLDELAMDSVVTFVNGFVSGTVVGLIEKAEAERLTGVTELQWWEATAPYVGQVFDPERFPTVARVGPVAGEALQAAYDPHHAFTFGLERVLDGVEALVRASAQRA